MTETRLAQTGSSHNVLLNRKRRFKELLLRKRNCRRACITTREGPSAKKTRAARNSVRVATSMRAPMATVTFARTAAARTTPILCQKDISTINIQAVRAHSLCPSRRTVKPDHQEVAPSLDLLPPLEFATWRVRGAGLKTDYNSRTARLGRHAVSVPRPRDGL